MTDFEEYKEHIEHTFNAYCKIVIRHTAIKHGKAAAQATGTGNYIG